MRLAAVATVCVVVGLIASGCGRGSAGATVSATHRSAPVASARTAHNRSPTPGRSPVTSTESAQQVQSPAHWLLTRPTRRPPDVSAQFEYVGGAGPGPCVDPGGPPRVRVFAQPFASNPGRSTNLNTDSGRVTFGQAVDICFNSLGRGPIDVSVNGPGGFATAGVLPQLPASFRNGAEWGSYDWVPSIEPSWPLGHYTILARSGSIRVSQSFVLVLPKETGLRVLGPSTDPGHNSVPPNSHAKLFLTGFRGSHSISLTTYRMTGFAGDARYFSTAHVPVPASGNTVLEIPTGPVTGNELTYIVTTPSAGVTLFAPFSLVREASVPGLIVGALPGSSAGH